MRTCRLSTAFSSKNRKPCSYFAFFDVAACAVLSVTMCIALCACKPRLLVHTSSELAAFIEKSALEENFPLALVERAALSFPDAAFYAAYLFEKKIEALPPEEKNRASNIAALLYKSALSNETVRDVAVQRLIPYVLKSRITAAGVIDTLGKLPQDAALQTLKAAAFLKLERFDEVQTLIYIDDAVPLASWNKALLLLAGFEKQPADAQAEKVHYPIALDYLLSGEIDEARRMLWEELPRKGSPFAVSENSAVNGRIFAANGDYKSAIEAFRPAWSANPQLFADFDALLSDLGRTFISAGQYTEGSALLLDWEKNSPKTIETQMFRYKCLYYAGRLRRTSGKRREAEDCFTRALAIAPDVLQEDACIWYLIDLSLNEKMETGISLLEKWAGKWHDGDYFSDIYDKIAQWAVSNKRWKTLVQLFPAIERGNSAVTRAKYAYILARALDDDRSSSFGRKSAELYQIAYSESGGHYYTDEALLYYRIMAGYRLGKEPDFITSYENAAASAAPNADSIRTKTGLFLKGFFTYGAQNYALAWIRDYIDTLPLDELRALSQLLQDKGLIGDSIRLGALYMKRAGFTPIPLDIQLYFPLGFTNLIERFSTEFSIDRSVLYGLVRTESLFIPGIVSYAGAAGLAQLMTETALDNAKGIARSGGPDYVEDGAVDRTNPEANLHIGAYFLRSLMNSQKNTLNALLAYNGGPARISRWSRASNLTPDLFLESIELRETREYGKKIIACAVMYNKIHFSLAAAPVIRNILK